ncbi:chemotaxis protein CheA [Tahibacter soli]|uniref:Chemotaxis protein CheA n=1 Tax=Tahibacter soli TaxID=2983605 RepID=A0A9X4BJ50_9GAMM|nr:chemotaxis protein CheA [Tahibacter soli]MDC8012882.1 chemotaxis protein CheA [Tahibacter soli]
MSGHASDVVADFIVEANEIVDRLGEDLVSLEQRPGDRELLNAIFRGFHTIKGGAGFFDFAPLVAVCHGVEELFNRLRAGNGEVDRGVFDAAQASLDAVAGMMRSIAAGTAPGSAPPALLDALQAATMQACPPAPAAAASSSAPVSDEEFDRLLDAFHNAPSPSVPAAAVSVPEAAAEPPRAAAVQPSTRVETHRLDSLMNLAGELVLASNRLKSLRRRFRDEALERAVGNLDVVTGRLQNAVMRLRMQPVGRAFSRFPKVVRDVARQLHKEVALVLAGEETELDKNVVEALADPLVHLVRNAIDHGIEPPDVRERRGKPRQGRLELSASQEGDHILVVVADDGGGIDPEALREEARARGLVDAESAARMSTEDCYDLIFLPGFSTREAVSEISGRGVGMDVVKTRIAAVSGRVAVRSDLGRGTRFEIRVPLTLAVLPTLLVACAKRVYALPLASVQEVFTFAPSQRRWLQGREVLDTRGEALPLVALGMWLDTAGTRSGEAFVVVVGQGGRRVGLLVDEVHGREDVVIKPLPGLVHGTAGYAGAAIIGDGRLAPILDAETFLAA